MRLKVHLHHCKWPDFLLLHGWIDILFIHSSLEPKEMKTGYKSCICSPTFIKAVLTIVKMNLNVHQIMTFKTLSLQSPASLCPQAESCFIYSSKLWVTTLHTGQCSGVCKHWEGLDTSCWLSIGRVAMFQHTGWLAPSQKDTPFFLNFLNISVL